MENNGLWWYLIPFCLGVVIWTLILLYGYHERTRSEQAVEEPVKVTKTVATEQKKTEVPVGKIKCVHSDANNGICLEYVIYRTIGE